MGLCLKARFMARSPKNASDLMSDVWHLVLEPHCMRHVLSLSPWMKHVLFVMRQIGGCTLHKQMILRKQKRVVRFEI